MKYRETDRHRQTKTESDRKRWRWRQTELETELVSGPITGILNLKTHPQ